VVRMDNKRPLSLLARASLLSFALGFSLLFAGCMGKASDATLANNSDNTSALQSFIKLQALMTADQANCIACHGVSQNPMFAVGAGTTNMSQVQISFNTIGPYLNVVPSQSLLLVGATNNHCAPTCFPPGSKASAPSVAQWTTAINNVVTASNSDGNSFSALTGYISPAQTVPQNLPVFSTKLKTVPTMSFDLGFVNTSYAGNKIQFEIALDEFNPTTSYVITNPVLITTATASITIAGFDILENNVLVQAQSPYTNDATTGAAGTTTPISTTNASLAISNTATDQISIRIQTIQLSN
jgi:hypothetical protein